MMNKSIIKRQEKNKELLLTQLKKVPIVQVACERVGISRATYYRWRKNPSFAKDSDTALQVGKLLVNDMAESQLISAIKDKHMTAIIFWLKHHHSDYTTRVELTTVPKTTEKLTNEQQELVEDSLVMAGLLPGNKTNE